MKIKSIPLIGVFCLFFSCKQTLPIVTKNNTKNPNSLSTPLSSSKDNSLEGEPNRQPESIIFGIFCGECESNCATMFMLDRIKNELSADYTDGFWNYKRGVEISFDTAILDTNKVNLAQQIIVHIPDSLLLNTKSRAQRFGCPDCTDGCGIYFETIRDSISGKFYIDSHTNQLSGEIKVFAEYLKKTIAQIKK